MRDHLHELGRDDLVDSAEVGVSELVTNGILHARTSIGLQLSGNDGRVIIEVYDGSPLTRQPAFASSPSTAGESTIGRGLRIVRAYADEWGVSTSARGKGIWFQPVPCRGADGAVSIRTTTQATAETDTHDIGEPLELDAMIESLATVLPDDAQRRGNAADEEHSADVAHVVLLGSPCRVVHHHRRRWLELLRELQLVALGAPSEQQEFARRLCAAAQVANADLYISERSALDYVRALTGGPDSIDATFEVPRFLLPAFVEMLELARALDGGPLARGMLYLVPGRQAAQLREWWLGEFIAQLDGAEPSPWPGDRRVQDEALAPSGSGAQA